MQLGSQSKKWGKALRTRKNGVAFLRDEAYLESFTGYNIKTVKTNHQAQSIIDDQDATRRPEPNFRVVFLGELSEIDINSLQQIFVELDVQCLIRHSSANSSTIMDAMGSEESELDDEYEWLVELGNTNR